MLLREYRQPLIELAPPRSCPQLIAPTRPIRGVVGKQKPDE